MDQLSRLISILTQLRSKRVVTATELSNKYEVSIRTIYRDIRKLENGGVPIVTLEGKGYSLMDGYTVAPVQFTEKEANALVMVEQLIKRSNEASLVADFGEAMTKIKSVFRSSIQEKSERLEKNIYVFNTTQEHISSNALSEIQLAITNRNYLEINYQKVYTAEKSFRKIEPVAIFSTYQKWILIAWCHLRLDYRAFRVDKIQHFKILEDQFEDRNFNLQAYFTNDPYDGPLH